MKKFSIHDSSGTIMVFASLILFPILLIWGFLLYSTTAPTVQNNARDLAKLLCLTGIKYYVRKECENPADTPACHTEKMDAAVFGAQAIADRNTKVLGEVTIAHSDSTADIEFDGVRFFQTEPPNDDPCLDDYPCMVPKANDEIATALRSEGEIVVDNNSILDFATSLFGMDDDITIDMSTACHMVALEIMVAVDKSPSTAMETHVSYSIPGAPGPHQANQGAHNSVRNFTPISGEQENLSVAQAEMIRKGAQSGEVRAKMENPFSPTIHAAYFGYPLMEDPDSPGSYIPREEIEDAWNNLGDTRPATPRNDPRIHYKSDYTIEVGTFGHDVQAWADYGDPQRDYHPNPNSVPATSPLYVQPGTTGEPNYYWYDGYRDPPNTRSPAPFLPILQATNMLVQHLEQRQLPDDRFGMIFYAHYLPWPWVINLSQDLTYIEDLLTDSIDGALVSDQFRALEPRSLPPITSYSNPLDNNAGRFYSLGLPPGADGFTDRLLPYIEAAHQFGSIAAERPSAKMVIDVTDGIGTCTRGDAAGSAALPECSDPPADNCCYPQFGPSSEPCCRSTWDVYNHAMNNTKHWVVEHFFQAGITLNIAQFGAPGGPHYKLINNPSHLGRCMSDSEARAAGYDWTKGIRFINNDHARARFNARYDVPFYQTAYDNWLLAKTTGGIYAPIMPQHPSCRSGGPFTPTCPPAAGEERMEFDTQCRSEADQLLDAFQDILDSAEGFSLIDPSIYRP